MSLLPIPKKTQYAAAACNDFLGLQRPKRQQAVDEIATNLSHLKQSGRRGDPNSQSLRSTFWSWLAESPQEGKLRSVCPWRSKALVAMWTSPCRT